MASLANLSIRAARIVRRFASGPFVPMPMLPNQTTVNSLILPTAGTPVDAAMPAFAKKVKVVRISPTTPKVGYLADGNAAAIPVGTDVTGNGSNFDEQFIDLMESDNKTQITRLSFVSDTDATVLSLKYFDN